ncbi:MAG: type II secretion system F family protein, partial [Sideroxyarcus sp.]|nr:type II secretion system F family protein [Sideroxyarcus sp.]
RSETNSEARNRRMRMLAKGASTEKILGLLKPAPDHWALSNMPIIGSLPKQLRLAGLAIKPWTFLLACIAATFFAAAVVALRFGPLLAAFIAVILCLGLPLWLLHGAGKKRIARLVQQLPDALDLMSRGLRVGHPLNTTIGTVANDMADPIASEFGVMLDQISYGEDLVNAFADLANRLDQEDVRYLSVSVAIQHGTGGNLSDVLKTLSKVIRDRITMRKRVAAISSEGRLTSNFLSCLPLFILGAMSFTAPDYYLGVSDDPLFRPIAIAVAVLIVANYLVMRKLVNFRI